MYNFALEEAESILSAVLNENGKMAMVQAKKYLYNKDYVYIEHTMSNFGYIILSKKFVNDIDEDILADDNYLVMDVGEYIQLMQDISDTNIAIHQAEVAKSFANMERYW